MQTASADSHIRKAFAQQANSCAGLGSPFMERLMGLCAARLQPGDPVSDTLFGWPGDPSPSVDSLPLRLAGALHALVIEGQDAQLAQCYPPHQVSDDSLWTAVTAAFAQHSTRLVTWLSFAPQTNEVRRSIALTPVFHLIARATGRPLALWEIGCSGGLNLRADLFRVETGAGAGFGPMDAPVSLAPGWTGPSPGPLEQPLDIIERRGVDLNPLDPLTEAHRLRLLAYLWADQTNRRTLTEAAIETARTTPADIVQADAIAWLRDALPQRRQDAATVLFHTVAWQYLPDAAKRAGDALIAEAGAKATAEAPLARVAMEARRDPDDPSSFLSRAVLSLTLWPGGVTLDLGTVDFHGRDMIWTGPVTHDPFLTRPAQ